MPVRATTGKPRVLSGALWGPLTQPGVRGAKEASRVDRNHYVESQGPSWNVQVEGCQGRELRAEGQSVHGQGV